MSAAGKRRAISLGVVAAALLGTLLAWYWVNSRRRATNEARYVAEAQAALEAYLRGEARDAGPRPEGGKSLDRAAVVDQFGELQEITGHGYGYPVWNIQDFHYLDAQRTAKFAKATVRLTIFVTEGRKTAPGETAVRVTQLTYHQSNGMTAYVAHPELVDPESP